MDFTSYCMTNVASIFNSVNKHDANYLPELTRRNTNTIVVTKIAHMKSNHSPSTVRVDMYKYHADVCLS